MRFRYFAVCSAILLAMLAAGNVCLSQALLTESQAMAAVRAFEGDHNLQLKSYGIEEDSQSMGQSHYYTIDAVATSDPCHTWTVNAGSGEVTSVIYHDRLPTTRTDTPYGTYTQTQCRQIALDFARAKYNDFDTLGFQIINDQWCSTGWVYCWRQVIAYGAKAWNYVKVNVDPTSGLVQSYGATRDPVFVPQQAPTITSQQAVQLAVQQLGIVILNWSRTSELSAGSRTLFWDVILSGEDSANKSLDWVTVSIDAYTGATLGVAYPGGARYTGTRGTITGKHRTNPSAMKPTSKLHGAIAERKLTAPKGKLKPAKASLSGKGSKATAKTKLTIQANPGGKKSAVCAKPTKPKSKPKTSKPQVTKPK